MNYIKQLEQDRADDHARDVKNAQIIAQLRQYLESDKFRTDKTVQVGDVLDRIADLNFHATTIEIYGPVCVKCHLHTYDGTDRHEKCI